MGAAPPPFPDEAAALAAGKTQDEIDAWKEEFGSAAAAVEGKDEVRLLFAWRVDAWRARARTENGGACVWGAYVDVGEKVGIVGERWDGHVRYRLCCVHATNVPHPTHTLSALPASHRVD